jgi:hypothetical protein
VHERPAHLLQSQEFLPSGLEILHITDVQESKLAKLCQKYAQGSEQGSAVDFVLGKAAILRLKKFELSVKMEYVSDNWSEVEDRVIELDESTRVFVPIVIEALQPLGTKMRVWRQEGRFPGRLLYEPGFAASEPHWGDVEKRYCAGYGRKRHLSNAAGESAASS